MGGNRRAWLAACTVVLTGAVATAGPISAGGGGGLDQSFGDGGTVEAGTGVERAAANAIIGLPDGRLVVAGGGADRDTAARIQVVAFRADGHPDAAFGHNGLVEIRTGDSDGAEALALQPDPAGGPPRLIVAASTYNGKGRHGDRDFSLARLHLDGELDPTFGDGGTVVTAPRYYDQEMRGVAVFADGGILVAGNWSQGNIMLARYHPDGRLDRRFGRRGLLTVKLKEGGSYERVEGLAVLPDGRFLVAGTMAPTERCAVEEGAPLSPPVGSPTAEVPVQTASTPRRPCPQADTLPNDGYAPVVKDDGVFVARFLPDGTLDDTFGDPVPDASRRRGFVVADFVVAPGNRSVDVAGGLAVADGGGIVVAGAVYCNQANTDCPPDQPQSDLALVRFTPDGTLDTTFGSGGTVRLDRPGQSEWALDLVAGLDGQGGQDGRMAVAGYSSGGEAPERFLVGLFDADGNPEAGFGEGGVALTTFSGDFARAQAVVSSGGGIVAAGVAGHEDAGERSDTVFTLARYLPPGP